MGFFLLVFFFSISLFSLSLPSCPAGSDCNRYAPLPRSWLALHTQPPPVVPAMYKWQLPVPRDVSRTGFQRHPDTAWPSMPRACSSYSSYTLTRGTSANRDRALWTMPPLSLSPRPRAAGSHHSPLLIYQVVGKGERQSQK